ncbi:MAG TPA: hypothetical protein PK095_08515, partial [Myxococcota bacterium]|nr:hypothetical protein [Myxococcota bacterium]
VDLGTAGALVHVSIAAEYDGNPQPTDLSLCYGTDPNGTGDPMRLDPLDPQSPPLQFRTLFPARNIELPGSNASTFSLSGVVIPRDPGTYFIGPCYKTPKGFYLYYGTGFVIPL